MCATRSSSHSTAGLGSSNAAAMLPAPRAGSDHSCQLVEVPSAERPEILRRYLRRVPGGRPHIPVSRHAPVADFATIAPRYPVFRVVPGEGGEP
jgi:hypothetical protein